MNICASDNRALLLNIRACFVGLLAIEYMIGKWIQSLKHLRSAMDDLLLIQALAPHHRLEAESDEETLDKSQGVTLPQS